MAKLTKTIKVNFRKQLQKHSFTSAQAKTIVGKLEAAIAGISSHHPFGKRDIILGYFDIDTGSILDNFTNPKSVVVCTDPDNLESNFTFYAPAYNKVFYPLLLLK